MFVNLFKTFQDFFRTHPHMLYITLKAILNSRQSLSDHFRLLQIHSKSLETHPGELKMSWGSLSLEKVVQNFLKSSPELFQTCQTNSIGFFWTCSRLIQAWLKLTKTILWFIDLLLDFFSRTVRYSLRLISLSFIRQNSLRLFQICSRFFDSSSCV